MSISSTEKPEVGNEISPPPTPFLDQLLAEIKRHEERQRALNMGSFEPTVESKSFKPEVRRNVSVLPVHSIPTNSVRQARLGKRASHQTDDEAIPGWLKAS
jgi:hypothetical protein